MSTEFRQGANTEEWEEREEQEERKRDPLPSGPVELVAFSDLDEKECMKTTLIDVSYYCS